MIPALDRVKAVHALDRAATVIGYAKLLPRSKYSDCVRQVLLAAEIGERR
jgi:hypothetical protein